jgi:two-component system response regulator HydG
VGGTKEMPLDIRIIVASNENLQDAYKKGTFREDLYHRFNEFSITLPRLAQRRDDIPLFAEFFLQKTITELDRSITGFDDDVMELFVNYSWPGNLRELRNVIRRAALLTASEKISRQAVPFEIISGNENVDPVYSEEQIKIFKEAAGNRKEVNLKNTTAKAEYDAILNALVMVNFNKSKAAELLNIDRKTLYNKIRTYEGNLLSASE